MICFLHRDLADILSRLPASSGYQEEPLEAFLRAWASRTWVQSCEESPTLRASGNAMDRVACAFVSASMAGAAIS